MESSDCFLTIFSGRRLDEMNVGLYFSKAVKTVTVVALVGH